MAAYRDAVYVDLPQAVYLNSGYPNFLRRLEKRVCCKFETQQVSWNEFKIKMEGIESGVKSARENIKKVIDSRFPQPSVNSLEKFEHFGRLPPELKQMIINQVPCTNLAKDKSDGLALMKLRAVSSEWKRLVDRKLKTSRKCFKKRIYIAETYRSNQIRLGTPPFESKIVVHMDEFDRLLGNIALDGEKEIHIRSEFRPEWCDTVMKLLLKHDHIKPTNLIFYGRNGKANLIHDYVAKNPQLDALIFEKTFAADGGCFIKQFMAYFMRCFYNLGPLDSLPENVRNGFNNRVIYTRSIKALREQKNLPARECNF